MIGDVTPRGTVVEVNKYLLYTEEVTDQRYCVNEKGNPVLEILREVTKQLYENNPELRAGEDYFGLGSLVKSDYCWGGHRTAVFYVKGGSEGYYVHVEQLRDDGHDCVFLGKTLLEGEDGIAWAEQMVCALSRILEV